MKQITIDITSETPALTFANVGIPGPRGIQGIQGERGPRFIYGDFTPAQLASLKGEKGEKGDTIVGPQGIKGDTGKGEKGDKGDKLTYNDLTEPDKDDLRQPILPYIDEAKLASDAAAKAASDASKAASDAQAILGKTIASGGVWLPATQEYPTVPSIDTLWLLKGSHTYTTGSLIGTAVTSGDQLFYDVSKAEWIVLDVAFSGIAKLNGKSGLEVTLTPADIGSYSTSEADAKFPLKSQLFSGNYSDLTNKPNLSVYRTVADSYSQTQVDQQFALKTQLFSGAYGDLTGKPDLSAGALGVLPTGYSYSKSESDNTYLPKTGKAADSELLDGIDSTGFCRAYSANYNTGVGGLWTTAEFVAWLKDKGALSQPYWVMRGSWSYGSNRTISDTGVGNIHLSGAVIEVIGSAGAYTIRITTPTTTSAGGVPSAQFTYINNGDGYAPGWRRDYNTAHKPTAADVGALPATAQAKDSKLLDGSPKAIPPTAGSVAQRDSTADISARMFRSTYPTQTTATDAAGICFRTNSAADNHMRFINKDGMHNWLGRVKDSTLFLGKTLDTVKAESRAGLVPNTVTINGKRLNANQTITKGDVGLGNVPNYAHTNSYNGTSTSLLATQKAAYDAAAAPRLAADRRRKITTGTAAPTGGTDGDIYLQYK